MRRVLTVAAGIFLCFIMQTAVFDLFKLADVVPNIMLVYVATISVIRGQKAGMTAGFFSGLLLDIFYGSYVGTMAFLYMLFGFIDGYFQRIYYSDDNFLPLVLIGVNDLVYGFIMFAVYGMLNNHLQLFYYMKSIILPEMVYTVAVAIVLYQILLRVTDRLDRTNGGSTDFV